MSGNAEVVRALGALCEPPARNSSLLAEALGLERAPGADEFVEGIHTTFDGCTSRVDNCLNAFNLALAMGFRSCADRKERFHDDG